MKILKQKKLALLVGAILSFSTSADVNVPPENIYLIPPTSNGIWYYEIGGADSLQLPMYNKSRFKFRGGLDWGGNLTCSDLDPDISISNVLNGLKKGWQSLQRNMVNSIKGTVASLPALALQHIDPGLYDLINSGLLSAEDQFQVEIASCQRITGDLMKAKPNYDWVKASGYEKYSKFFTGDESNGGKNPELQKADAGELVSEMEKDLGKEGVNWICDDKRGGVGQKPIVMSETVWAGYNTLIDRGACETIAPAKSSANPTFVKYWPSPKEAQNWLIDIFGDAEVYTDPRKPPRTSKTGAGLMMKIEETTEVIAADLTSLVDDVRNDNYEPTLKDLQQVSAPGTLITREVIVAIAKSGDSSLYIKKLAVDMASQREMLKAMEMRRVLYSASMVTEISQAKPAKEIVDYWMRRIVEEVRLVREEMELRRFLNQNTLPSILASDFNQTLKAIK
jgi:integrating conjugative element protein (TIGR03755 family)